MRAVILSLLIAGAYGASWDKVGQEIPGDDNGDLSGWSVDTSADGSVVVIGTPKNSEDDPNAGSTAGGEGHVRVYHLVGGAWTQKGSTITEDGTSDVPHDQFGYSVAISADGDTIAIGEPMHATDQIFGIKSYSGRVHIYKFENDEWTRRITKQGPQAGTTPASSYRFGHSVSLSDDGGTVAVGSPDHPKGIVYVYHGSDYQPFGLVQGSANGDKFGTSVSLSADGQYLAVGAIESDSAGAVEAGHAKVYQNIGNGWVLQTTIEGTTANGEKGISVSLSDSGTRIAIGASHTDVGVPGLARVYDVAGDTFTQVGSDIVGSGDNDLSGYSVSLSGDGTRLAVGAPQNDDADAGTRSGLVRLYDLSGNTWRATGGSIVGENAGNKAGHSVALSRDGTRVAVGAPRAFSDPQRPGGTTIYEYSASSSALSTEAIVGIAVGGTALVVAIAAIVISKSSGRTDGSVFELLVRKDNA
jgi:hypothetical protein